MRLPISARRVCQTDWITRMVHLIIADINADMCDIIAAIIRPLKEQKVTRLGIFQRKMLGRFILRLRRAWQVDARYTIAPVSYTHLDVYKRQEHAPYF